MPSRLLVVANRTCPCPGLVDAIGARLDAAVDARVLVIAPALNSRLRHYVSDVDGAIAAARERLDIAIFALRHAGISSEGAIGDSDPVTAIADALIDFRADQVLVSTWPEGRSHWLEKRLLQRARARFDIPVDHIVSNYDLPVAAA